MIVHRATPWEEDATTQGQVALGVLVKARLRADALAPRLHRSMRQDVQRLGAALAALEDTYRADETAFRRTRALTAVHLPTLMDALEQLAEMEDAQTGSEDARATLRQTLTACFAAVHDAKDRHDARAVDRLALDADTLRDRVAPDSAPGTPLPDSDTDVRDEGRGWMDTARGAIGGHLTRIGQSRLVQTTTRQIQESTAQVAAATQTGAADVLDTARGAVAYTRTRVGGVARETVADLTQPLAIRITATRAALEDAVVSATGVGLVVSLIFPPVAPFLAGLALLDAGATYSATLDAERAAADRLRAEGRAQDAAALEAAQAQMKGHRTVRLETAHVHVTIDRTTGAADGVILSGRHVGVRLAELDAETLRVLERTAPDTETAQILETWRRRRG